ncbi:histidine phosphatase family protein [Catellatospora vulcania]|uniref:histidine phosphatase family protein n=1 Tax=Catellatospora vulcania TaxID=1460450 RepID=UPI0012D42834|nr:histidine phosphatase family protein [Catellatospora vulcania]
MRTRLIFVRHGESVHSVERFVGGRQGCRGLTARGHEQAAETARRLAGEVSGPVAVYSSVLRRALETAAPIAAALGADVVADCGLCTWHYPAYADGRPLAVLKDAELPGGGVHRPFQRENESWAELVVRTGRAIMDIAYRHAGQTVVLVGHSETINGSFHVLGMQPLLRAFDTVVAPGSVTEWTADGDPVTSPPTRWTLHRFSA